MHFDPDWNRHGGWGYGLLKRFKERLFMVASRGENAVETGIL